VGYERQRGSKESAHGGTDERAPRHGRRRRPKHTPRVVHVGPPESDDERGFSTGGSRRPRGGRGGRHRGLVDEAMEDASYDEDEYGEVETDEDDWQSAADEFFAGEHETEGTESEADDGGSSAAQGVTITIGPSSDGTSGVQVASPEVESLAQQSSAALERGDVDAARELQSEQVEQEREELIEVAKTVPSDAPERPALDEAIKLSKDGPEKLDDEEREEPEQQAAETTAASPLIAEVQTQLTLKGITWEELDNDQQQRLIALGKTLQQYWDPQDHSKAKSGGKRQTQVAKQNFGQATRSIDTVLQEVLAARAAAGKKAKEAADAKQLAADFASDKARLLAKVKACEVSAGGREVLEAVVKAMELGTGFDAEIEKGYPEADIVDAHRKWGLLIQKGMIGKYAVRVISKIWGPNYDEPTIGWKVRGKYLERNRNFMARVGKHQANVHVSPLGPRRKPI
jgi:hypothetical protein